MTVPRAERRRPGAKLWRIKCKRGDKTLDVYESHKIAATMEWFARAEYIGSSKEYALYQEVES